MGTTFKFEDKLNILGNIIYKFRLEKDLSLEELSAKLQLYGINLPADSIYQIENNRRAIKDYELAGISNILNFSVDNEFQKFMQSLQ